MNDLTWALLITIGVYGLFQWIQKKTKQTYLNPLLLSSAVLIAILLIFRIDYERYQKSTEFITFLIAPATVSLAIPLYENLKVLKKDWKIIMITILVGVFAHALVIGGLSLMLKLTPELIATFIPKSVTTPIAKDVSESLGGIKYLTVAIVIITGILGSVISPFVFKVLNIESPVARGLSLGSSAHAVGTAKASELGEIEASMATLSLIITGILTVILSPFVYQIIIYLMN